MAEKPCLHCAITKTIDTFFAEAGGETAPNGTPYRDVTEVIRALMDNLGDVVRDTAPEHRVAVITYMLAGFQACINEAQAEPSAVETRH